MRGVDDATATGLVARRFRSRSGGHGATHRRVRRVQDGEIRQAADIGVE